MSPPVSAPPPQRPATNARPLRGKRRAPISLTPLIDVVFILLVFFMLASSFIDWRAIELGAPAQAVSGTSMEGALLVEVRADGLRLSGERMSLEALAARVRERLAVRADRTVLVKPAPGVPLQAAVDVLDRLASVGVTELSLIRARGG